MMLRSGSRLASSAQVRIALIPLAESNSWDTCQQFGVESSRVVANVHSANVLTRFRVDDEGHVGGSVALVCRGVVTHELNIRSK